MVQRPARRRSLFDRSEGDKPRSYRDELKKISVEYMALLDTVPSIQLPEIRNEIIIDDDILKEKDLDIFDVDNYLDAVNQFIKRHNTVVKEMQSIEKDLTEIETNLFSIHKKKM